MRIKTLFIIFFTALFTVVMMQNTDSVRFSFLFTEFMVSKTVMFLGVAIIGFIIGVLVGRPSKTKHLPEENGEIDVKKNTNTLTNEDRDYIS